MPAYHHGSEIEALLQAGLRIRYYKLDRNLAPDPAELKQLLSSRVRALYLIHYLGFPQDLTRWRQWCNAHQLLLIEDAAQAFLASHDGRPVGSFGDLAFFCLYKTYGLPDGGALISVAPPPLPTLPAPSGMWRLFKRHFNWVAQRSGILGALHLQLAPMVQRWKKRRAAPHQEFDLQDPATPPTAMTTRLLPLLLDPETAKRRRRNYRYLLRHLGALVPQPFATLPEGACPFAFPVAVAQPEVFLQQLRHHGVIGLLFWLNPHPSLPVADFPECKLLRDHLLALPVHQELSKSSLRQIVAAVRAACPDENLALPANLSADRQTSPQRVVSSQ